MQHRSGHSARTAGRFGRERLFLAALLLALASALVPALIFPANGALGRGGAGSAFDPTTSAVTLRLREQGGEQLIARASDDGDRAETIHLPFLALNAGIALALAVILSIGALTAPQAAPLVPVRVRSRAQPRAPPASLS